MQLLKHLHQEANFQLTISKYPDGAPKGQPLMDKLGQTILGIPNHKALGLIVGAPGAVGSS